MIEIDQPRLSTPALSSLRVALVHYWLVSYRGGERVLGVLAEMFPQADIFTLVLDRASLPPSLRSRKITPSFLQKIPGVKHHYQKFLPLFPLALEHLNLSGYDLVISSEAGPAKGVLTSQHTCHICYCHSPMRYLWDMYHEYRNGDGMGRLSRAVFSLSSHYVRMWDFASAARVDYFVASCRNAASRIQKHYRRESEVIYPPIRISEGYLSDSTEDYYLVASPLVAYKRVDLAIAACNRLRRRLRIIGEGPEMERLRRLSGPTVEFLGFIPDEPLRKQYACCRALLFPGEEDFGAVPVEAQSYGRPVIAYGRGGALETVQGFFAEGAEARKSPTGIFFSSQTAESLMNAIQVFESVETGFSPALIRNHVQRFDTARFKIEMSDYIARKLKEFRGAADCAGHSACATRRSGGFTPPR